MSRLEDLTGRRYGHLVVVEYAGSHKMPSGGRKTEWKCLCDCGKEVICMSCNLKSGNSKSCGCFGRESTTKASIKHGDRHSRLYSIFTNMKDRCYNPNSHSYKDYGERGIKVCDEWINCYPAFKRWATENGYKDTLSIDRIDVNKGYSPENCRWTDAVVQANNRRNTIMISAFGQKHSLSEWAKITGIKYHTLYARIYILKMAVEDAIPFSKIETC